MIQRFFSNKWLFSSYLIVIILLVTLPINSAGDLNSITIITFRGDYFFHALAFIPWYLFKPVFNHKHLKWLAWGLLFAASTEGLQYILPYRAYNVNDLLANVIGIILGALLYLFFKQILSLKSINQL